MWCGWAASWLWAFLVPLPLFFFGGGVCLFLPLPSLGWCTHWSAFGVVNQVAVGPCVLVGLAPAPWVGWVMCTLGSAALPIGLVSGSASWAVAPGGFVRPWVRGAGVFCVPSPPWCRYYHFGGGLCGCTASVVVARAVTIGRFLAGWCGAFRGVWRLGWVRPSVSVPCFGVVVCCGAPCRVVPCFAELRRAGPCCVAVRPAGSCRVAPCRSVVCRAVLPRVASCCGVLSRGMPCCGALHGGTLPCGVPCCLVFCPGGLVEVSPARVFLRSAGQSVAGWWLGGAVRCGVARWVRAVGVWACRSGWCVWQVSAKLPALGGCALVPCRLGVLASSPGSCGRALFLFGCL